MKRLIEIAKEMKEHEILENFSDEFIVDFFIYEKKERVPLKFILKVIKNRAILNLNEIWDELNQRNIREALYSFWKANDKWSIRETVLFLNSYYQIEKNPDELLRAGYMLSKNAIFHFLKYGKGDFYKQEYDFLKNQDSIFKFLNNCNMEEQKKIFKKIKKQYKNK